jgi:hypothetical protein
MVEGRPQIVSELLDAEFRSRFELNIAEWFYEHGLSLAYEPVTFQVEGQNGLLYYTPDFFHHLSHTFIEAKGVWAGGQRKKILSCLKQYPDMRLLFLHWSLHTEFNGSHHE